MFVRGGRGGVGSSTSMISGVGEFYRVFCCCVQGVNWRIRQYVELLDGVKLVATLGDGTGSILDGVTLSTLCGPTLTTLGGVSTSFLCWGLLQRKDTSFLVAAVSFCLRPK